MVWPHKRPSSRQQILLKAREKTAATNRSKAIAVHEQLGGPLVLSTVTEKLVQVKLALGSVERTCFAQRHECASARMDKRQSETPAGALKRMKASV